MDTNKLRDDLNHVLDILDPYLNINSKDYIHNPSIRSHLVSMQEPLMGLAEKVKHMIVQEKANSIRSGMCEEDRKRLASSLGLE